MRIPSHKRLVVETSEICIMLNSAFAAQSVAVRVIFRTCAIPDLVIGGGFTDDAITTTDAGGSPHPQLLAFNSPGLRSQRSRFRRVLQQIAREARPGGDSLIPAFPAQRETRKT